ncbi:hypothetical protein H364_09920 [Pasteurella multocida 671/90]|nr:hypothetical protein NT08PM_1970 [Pasteurella multocida subsp. multocida str. 3480]EPE71203.1 hypothetical protein H364_09920 [Pasteurella multocida 671/90]
MYPTKDSAHPRQVQKQNIPKKSIDCMQYDVYPTFTKYPSKKSMRYLQKAKNH